jgi:hypothetical protein
MRRKLARHAAHLAHFGDVHNNPGNADHVELIIFQLAREVIAHGEVQHGTGRRNVRLDHHDAPRAMEHAQRETALRARHLIVIEFHRVDGAAAELIVLCVWSEDRAEQNAGL